MKDIKLSDFGNKIIADAGILELMDDLGRAMSGNSQPIAMFGGGNPALIPEVSSEFEKSLQNIVTDQKRLCQMFGQYDTPQGNEMFIKSIVEYFNSKFDTKITKSNVAITPGSQAGFFMLFNLLAGQSGSVKKHILMPIAPEYIGYGDQLIEKGCIKAYKPKIEKISDHEFKYHIDFQALEIDENTAAICVSRPTNPSGNVISGEEIIRLQQLADQHNIPLIIDNAYGDPFPGVIEGQKIELSDNTVFSFSLSKVGLPGSRTGIFIGPESIIKALINANAVVNLTSPNFGQYLTTELFRTKKIDELSKEYIQPYYVERYAKAWELIEQHFDKSLPWRFHTYEGSYFLWLWLEGSNKTSKEIYSSLKERGVIVVPGEYFFFGVDTDNWSHAKECIRINFARPDKELEKGIPILAEVLSQLYK